MSESKLKIKKGVVASLATTTPESRGRDRQDNVLLEYTCHLEITLKHPMTTAWVNMSSKKQKLVYSKYWNDIKNTVSVPVDSGYVFEYHENGNVHLHGYLVYHFKHAYSPIGMVADYAKAYLPFMPEKRYRNYVNSNMHYDWVRYQSPQICVQYKEDEDRLEAWKNYMQKEDFNKNNIKK